MATPQSKKFVYVQGDEAKKPVDLKAQTKGTDLVLVLASGKEIPFKFGDVKFRDPEVAAAYKAEHGEVESALRPRMARTAKVQKPAMAALSSTDVDALLSAAKEKATAAAAAKGPFKKP